LKVLEFDFDKWARTLVFDINIVADAVADCVAALWTFMWFVCFCFLVDAWRRTSSLPAVQNKSAGDAAVVFSFFSIAVFVSCCFPSIATLVSQKVKN